ncbi:hypothetical protein WA026_005495 [Henosepilachna vigintioctopunctata]|uniref:ATP-dependent RNA helicase n=1 Tax=Henosepilachna vigintioctopunctata TaxID=420089 RepID=A0AAW1TWI0_9CUCU
MEGKWKPVSLDGAVFTGDFNDLIGIEECSGYELENQCNKVSKGQINSKSTKNKLKKRKKSIIKNLEVVSPSKAGSTSEESVKIDHFQAIEDELSMEAWNEYDLSEVILKGLQDQGFKYPTTIQALSLPPAIFGKKDILGAAETGSGKTLAFGLPILNSIVKMKSDDKSSQDSLNLCALILTPTRELAIQVKNHLQLVAKYSNVNVVAIVGGMAAVKQERLLNRLPEIVVATPGRLWELIQLGYGQLSEIDRIKFLVIDEVDRMLEKGHFLELQNLLEKVNFDEDSKKRRQNFVFSATLELVHDLPKYLKKVKRKAQNTPEMKLKKLIQTLGITEPKVVSVSRGVSLPESLTESRVNCSIIEKDYYVYYFLQKYPGRTMIFCNSIGCVKRLTTLLTLLECHPFPLHASLQQKQRLKYLEKFREKEDSILIATDVAARGLDIPSIDHVIHYQVPRTTESYIHRSGRTARANKQGLTLLIIDPSELQNYFKVCKTLKKSEDISVFPVQQNYFEAIKQRVNLARELDKLQLQIKKTNLEVNWIDKAAKEMDIIVDNKPNNSKELTKGKKFLDIKKKQLASLLQKPIFLERAKGKCFSQIEGFLLENTTNSIQFQESAINTLKHTMESSKSRKRKFGTWKSKK